MKLNKTALVFLLFLTQVIFADIAICKEAEVFYVNTAVHGQNEAKDVKLACDLLGVRFRQHFINTKNDKEILKSIRELHDKEVLILSARVLKYFSEDNVLLFGKSIRKTKILISGINANTDIAYLKLWSENKIIDYRQFHVPIPTASIRVIENKKIARELGGLEYPLIGSGSVMINGFELTAAAEAENLIEVVYESSKIKFPILFTADSAGKRVFYLSSWQEVVANKTDNLFKIMPFLMFLKYSFSDRCWHGINDYANFTIDDPWLREPYGYISFADLCREAKKVPFHATIGFIPYNYKKSNKDAVEIFQQCHKNLSVAVHGNNHDFLEFRTNMNMQLADRKSKPIHPDEKNILQALYRMDKFSLKTGIPYDRVMIFPRGVFTKESLGLLKKHNFLMTINSTCPFNAGNWTNSVDRLRGITLEHESFPMLLRYGISDRKTDRQFKVLTNAWIRMRLFLDLPVFLYTHVSFFKEGAHAFNSLAQTVNKAQPTVVWSSLGTIAKKLYLQKRINEHEIEILAYSSNLVIKNNYSVTMKYIVKKQEDFLIPIQSVEVNGTKHEYHRDGKYIRVEVLIEPGCEKNIRILYYSDYQVGSFTYSDSGLKTLVVRTLSDFRDIYLSKLPLGDKFVSILYGLGGVKNVLLFILGLTGIFLILLVWCIKHRKAKKRFSQNNL